MRIINVITEFSGIINKIESFPIFDEQLSGEVIGRAKDLFEKLIKENYKFYPDDNIEEILENAKDNGYFTDEGNNYFTIYLIWSEVNL